MTNANDDGNFEKRFAGGGDFNDLNRDRRELAEKCVARVWLNAPLGSGVLLAGNWFLTNHHVLPDKATAKRAIAEFNFEQGPDGSPTTPVRFWFDPDAGFHTSPAVDGDDWTVVKLKGDANAKIGAWTLEEVVIHLDIVSVIQHPDGLPKKIAIDYVIEIVEVPVRRIRYRAATLPGSSGSPVFNQSWQMVGLHHSSATSRNRETGAAIECNEGISIAAILEGLKAKGVWPHRPGIRESQETRLVAANRRRDHRRTGSGLYLWLFSRICGWILVWGDGLEHEVKRFLRLRRSEIHGLFS